MDHLPFRIGLKPGLDVACHFDRVIISQRHPFLPDILQAYEVQIAAPWMEGAIRVLVQGIDARELLQRLQDSGGPRAVAQLTEVLEQLTERGWITYQAGSVALATPINTHPTLHAWASGSSDHRFSLSRFAYIRVFEGHTVVESPLTKFRLALLDCRAAAVLARLSQPATRADLQSIAVLASEDLEGLLRLLSLTGFLDVASGSRTLELWEFHNLLFHAYSRSGRHDHLGSRGLEDSEAEDNDRFPMLKPAMSERKIPLPKADLAAIAARDPSLLEVMEERRTHRTHDDANPITLDQLGEFLYRAARVTSTFKLADRYHPKMASFVSADQMDALMRMLHSDAMTDRVYPAGGSLYELEIYLLVRLCSGLEPGLYHYDPLGHQLEHVRDITPDGQQLLNQYKRAMLGADNHPQICVLIASRFGRSFKKYRYVGYSLILKHVGVLYQNFYLVATALGLAPCAVGGGDSDLFSRLSGLDYVEETTVGEFMLGSKGEETGLAAWAKSRDQAEPSEDRPAVTASRLFGPLPQMPPVPVASPFGHDLEPRIPGLADLRRTTLGDPRVTVVVLDGDPDLSLACFRNPNLSKATAYWRPPPRPISREAYTLYRRIIEDGSSKEARVRELQRVFGEDAIAHIEFNRHATSIASVIAGVPGSAVPGIAPGCRVIVLPIATDGDVGEYISALNLTRAIEFALELGAHIIHCSPCRPTQSGQMDRLLQRALETCHRQGVLVVAPVGNDKGECSCIPAIVPGVLAVGALTRDGTPVDYNNMTELHAASILLAPGKEILCAQPGTDEPTRQEGTSLAAPVVTGIAALLMSRQVALGYVPDGGAVTRLLLETATPYPNQPASVLNLPAALWALSNPFGLQTRSMTDAGSRPEAAAVREATVRSGVMPSRAFSGNVFALGRIGFDFDDELKRDAFASRMAEGNAVSIGGSLLDPVSIVTHLKAHPEDANLLIWTLECDGAPLFALEPEGVNASEICAALTSLLEGQCRPEDAPDRIEHVSIPGRSVNRVVDLVSGQNLPVVALRDMRGLYGWNNRALIDAAIGASAVRTAGRNEAAFRQALDSFMNRIYHDLANTGQTARDRAMNFAATNIYQSVAVFAEALAEGRELATVATEKSTFSRAESDCWDIRLDFVDPENQHGSFKVYRFTIDVADTMPVTVGQIRTWFVSGSSAGADCPDSPV